MADYYNMFWRILHHSKGHLLFHLTIKNIFNFYIKIHEFFRLFLRQRLDNNNVVYMSPFPLLLRNNKSNKQKFIIALCTKLNQLSSIKIKCVHMYVHGGYLITGRTYWTIFWRLFFVFLSLKYWYMSIKPLIK